MLPWCYSRLDSKTDTLELDLFAGQYRIGARMALVEFDPASPDVEQLNVYDHYEQQSVAVGEVTELKIPVPPLDEGLKDPRRSSIWNKRGSSWQMRASVDAAEN
jgi:hypothetical protein